MGSIALTAFVMCGALALACAWYVWRVLSRLQPLVDELPPIDDGDYLLASLAWDAYAAALAREGRQPEPAEVTEIRVESTRQRVIVTFRPRLPHENDVAIWHSFLASGVGVTPPSRLKREAAARK